MYLSRSDLIATEEEEGGEEEPILSPTVTEHTMHSLLCARPAAHPLAAARPSPSARAAGRIPST
jgi:hypothetical protein